jgi:hypothetical protein
MIDWNKIEHRQKLLISIKELKDTTDIGLNKIAKILMDIRDDLKTIKGKDD